MFGNYLRYMCDEVDERIGAGGGRQHSKYSRAFARATANRSGRQAAWPLGK